MLCALLSRALSLRYSVLISAGLARIAHELARHRIGGPLGAVGLLSSGLKIACLLTDQPLTPLVLLCAFGVAVDGVQNLHVFLLIRC